jgi:hypothetical protein
MRSSIFVGLGAVGAVSLALVTGMGGCGGTTSDIPDGGGPDSTADSPSKTDGGGGGQDVFQQKDSTGGGDAKGNDASDGGGGSETGMVGETGSSTINCPTAPCGTGLGCCADLTGADAGFHCESSCTNALDCLSNTDCSGSTPICCATAVIDDPTGTPPSCIETGAKSVTTACTASSACASNIPLTMLCNETDTVRGCTTPSDCNDKSYPDCCEIMVAGSTLQGCVSDLIKGAAKLTCM